MNVLLIDDDDEMRSVLTTILEREGYTVRAAADGNRIERLILEVKPDIVVCDMLMPDREGFEVLRVVRRNSPQSRFIMISGASGDLESFLRQAPKLGADAILAKPFTPDELIETLRTVTSGSTDE